MLSGENRVKIALEALGIDDYGGGRTASLNLFKHLTEIAPQHEYLAILTQAEPSLAMEQSVVPIENRFLARIWAQAVLPIKMRDYDLAHFVKNLAVFQMPIPTVVTVYDMTPLLYPDLFPKVDVWYWQHVQARSLEQANAVIAISHTTKSDIERCYSMEGSKIHVVYPSVSTRFRPAGSEALAHIGEKYGLPRDYILHVGRLDRKNNIAALVEGFARFRQQAEPGYRGKLVIVGGRYAKTPSADLDSIIEQAGLQNEVILTGRVSDDDLPALYSGAQVAVLTSWHEGFGLVAVEAMACGTPLIAHRSGAIPEVAGDAALLFDSPDSETIAAALEEVIGEPELRARLQQRGQQRARLFQAKEDARAVLKIYQEVIKARS
jgi:glycosyltransferase involved in cell wall biosynthesis